MYLALDNGLQLAFELLQIFLKYPYQIVNIKKKMGFVNPL